MRGLLPCIGLLLGLAAAPLEAQTVRATGASTLRYVGLRPLLLDSVPVGLTEGDGVLRRTTDGRLVRCVPGALSCHHYRSGTPTGMVPVIQDVGVSAWGLGRGISAYAQVRARADLGQGSAAWPRADDPVDVLEAYAEFERPAYRLRGGRQWRTSGLGYYNFDGLSALYRLDPRLSVEGFAGWTLVRGLNEPVTTEALAAVETYVPQRRGVLMGAELRARPSPATSLTASYQREIRSDRGALYGERMALDGVVRRGAAALELELDADVAGRDLSEARLRLRLPPFKDVRAHLQARRYRPYFELWTIWSVFRPVGFSEVGGGAAWSAAHHPVALAVRGARRTYDATGADLTFVDLRDTGWFVDVTAEVEPWSAWRLSGAYAADLGFGAAKGQGSARVERRFGSGSHGGLVLHAFQRSTELRVTEGTVVGMSADAALRLSGRAGVSGALSFYHHADAGGAAPTVDWSQWRALVRLNWVVGPEPGMATAVGGGS